MRLSDEQIKDLREKEKLYKSIAENGFAIDICRNMLDTIEALQQENEQLRAQIGEIEDKGKISDGYHTFDELYYHRMILFSVICNHHKDIAWKSWKHADGTMFDGYFIVGVTTPKGEYTYHYQKQYWDMFDVKELPTAPEWDGHQPKDIDRLLSITSPIEQLRAKLEDWKYETKCHMDEVMARDKEIKQLRAQVGKMSEKAERTIAQLETQNKALLEQLANIHKLQPNVTMSIPANYHNPAGAEALKKIKDCIKQWNESGIADWIDEIERITDKAIGGKEDA